MAMYTGKPHFLFNPSRRGPKSGKKEEKAIKRYHEVLAMEPSPYRSKELLKAIARMKKYGLPLTRDNSAKTEKPKNVVELKPKSTKAKSDKKEVKTSSDKVVELKPETKVEEEKAA